MMHRFLVVLTGRPWLVFTAVFAVSAAFFVGVAGNTRMETDLDKYMPKDHPAFVYSDEAEEWFDIKDGIIVAVEHPGGIYNPGTLSKVRDLTKALQKHDRVDRGDVTSLYTADNITGSEGGLDVRAFYSKVPQSELELDVLRANVRANDMMHGRLVSEDETVTLVIAEIGDEAFSQEFYHEILDLAAGYEGPEKLYVAGRPIVEGTMAYLAPKDMKRMVPIVLLVIIAVLLLVLRSPKSTVFTLLVVVLSTLWTFGLMAWMGIPIYAVSTMIPVMLIAIGVADGIHIYGHLGLYQRKHPGTGGRDSASEMIRGMWKPVVMTSVTTAVGFVSLLTSDVYPIKYFGMFTAFGVMVAMVLSLVLIPAGVVAFGPPKARKANSKREGTDDIAVRFAKGLMRHKRLIVAAAIIVVVASAMGATKIWINSSFLEKFERDSDIVLTDAFINERFGGTSTLNVILESADEGGMKSPDVLRLMDEMQTESETLAEVGNSFGLADYLRRINMVMHADSPEFDTIPESTELVAQYLLLYEMSGDPETLWRTVDYDYASSNVTLQLKGDDSKTINSAIAVVEKFRPLFEELGVSVNYAGSGYKSLIFSDLILKGQVKSLVLSLGIIVVLLSLMFRRISAGLIGVIPISITAIVSFGAMGLLNIPLSTTTALISSIAVGVGIDYAVHFMERFRVAAKSTGDVLATVADTMHHSGRAILFNAVVVIAGFLVLLYSAFPPNRALGVLVSGNMFVSLLGTITIMVVVMIQTKTFFRKRD
ncbi:MAG: MMPL family transporter [Candidatus Eisenbacteria bacterium]